MRWPEVMKSMEPDDAATFAVGLVAREAVMLDGQLGKVHDIVRARAESPMRSRPQQFSPTLSQARDEVAKGVLLGDDTELGVQILDAAEERYRTRNRYVHDRLIVSHENHLFSRHLITGAYTDGDISHILETYLGLVGSAWQLVALAALLLGDDDEDWRLIAEGDFTAHYGGAVSYPAT